MGKSMKFWFAWMALACGLLASQLAAQAPGSVRVLEVQGAISPATADFIVNGIGEAEAAGAQLLVIELDTPGGLDASMRAIVRRMLTAELPIAVYVAPGGARAASAGTFILYASHIAAMSPASNLGAASPVAISGGMPGGGAEPKPEAPREDEGKPESAEQGVGRTEGAQATVPRDTRAAKAANDAAAYLRSLAELRDRDPEFATAAVREARSLPAAEALKADVIEYVAPSLESLLTQIDGLEVQLDNGNTVTLATEDVRVERIAPDWRTHLLSFLADPQLAVILMMLGVYGLFFEMMSPGATLPGVAGLICLLLGFYGLHMLPVNWAGVALLALGLIMMIGEVFLPSFGALGVGGLIAFVLGGLFMTGPELPAAYEFSIPFLVSLALASAFIIIGAGTVALRSRRGTPVSGHEAMVGEQGTVVALEHGMIYAEVRGEHWSVLCTEPLQVGDRVRVTDAQGLQLRVSRNTRTNDTNRGPVAPA